MDFQCFECSRLSEELRRSEEYTKSLLATIQSLSAKVELLQNNNLYLEDLIQISKKKEKKKIAKKPKATTPEGELRRQLKQIEATLQVKMEVIVTQERIIANLKKQQQEPKTDESNTPDLHDMLRIQPNLHKHELTKSFIKLETK